MHLTTAFPLATLFFKHWHTDDTEVGVVIAKACFRRDGAGLFRPDAAPDLILADGFVGDPATTPLRAEQDLAPFKPATDIIVQATARSPRGAALPDWPVRITVPDRLAYDFQVRGPAQWERDRTGWRIAPPSPVFEVPLGYHLAYGGTALGRDGPEVFASNPAGLGFATPALLDRTDAFAAPQIGDLAEFMAAAPLTPMMVHGFGPVAKAWIPRLAHAGTFDEVWRTTRHPRMPTDYDLRFWNAAHRRLQVTPYMTGTEVLTVDGIAHGGPVTVPLPGAALLLQAWGEATLEAPMVLDTIMADLTAADQGEHRLLLTWRCMVARPTLYAEAAIHGIDAKG
jgi:hypothetical protein